MECFGHAGLLAKRGTHAGGLVDPRASAYDPASHHTSLGRATGSTSKIIRFIFRRIGFIARARPLPDISEHIFQPPGIGLEASNRGGCGIPVVAWMGRPVKAGKLAAGITVICVGRVTGRSQIVSPIPGTLNASTGSHFPFRFGWQSEGFDGLLTEPLCVGRGVIPMDADNGLCVIVERKIFIGTAVVSWPKVTIVGVGRFSVSHPVGFQADGLLLFVQPASPFTHGTAHFEAAFRNKDQGNRDTMNNKGGRLEYGMR